MSLDVHAHLYPKKYCDFLEKRGGPSKSMAGRVYALAAGNPFFTGAIDARLELMDAAAIGRQVLSIPNQNILVEDAAVSAIHAAAANDELAAVCQRYPERFTLFASLPLIDAEAALRELRRARETHGAVGIIVPTHVLGRPLDWDGMEPVYGALEEMGLPLFLHPLDPICPAAPAGFPHLGLTPAIYYPTEDANALMRMIYGGVLERHPRLRVICPHLGGVAPFLLWRLQGHPGKEGSGESGAGLPHPISHYLDRVFFDSVTLHAPAMRCACDTFGPGRLVLGTDFPFVDGPGMKKIRQLIDELPITAQEREGMLEKNIREWIP